LVNSDYKLFHLGILFDEIKFGKRFSLEINKGKYRISIISSISDGIFNIQKTKWTNDKVNEADFLQNEDILFSYRNSMDNIGKTAFFSSNEKVIHGANLIRLRTKNPIIIPRFALAIFKSKYFLEIVKSQATEGVYNASISIQAIRNIEIPVPPINIQEEIVRGIEIDQLEIRKKENEIDCLTIISKEKVNDVWSNCSKLPQKLSKEEILEGIESGILVYPSQWHELFMLIKSKIPETIEIPNPLILGGSGASNYDKNQRLKDHLNIAKKYSVLDDALDFLSKLPDGEWIRSKNGLDPNELSYWEIMAEDDEKLRLVNLKSLPYLKKLQKLNSEMYEYEKLSKVINDNIIVSSQSAIYLVSDNSQFNSYLIQLHEIYLNQKKLNVGRTDIEDFCNDILVLQEESKDD
jgi:hypothetical protein